jgi:GGDEF domain-containing protein
MRFDQHASPHAISRFRADQRSAVSLCSVASDRADDPLTGLATRQGLIDYLDQLLANPALDTHPAALLLLDLDRFKTMNDRMGPLVCDRLLCHVARRLRTVVPGAALIARVSGDEFAVLVSDAATSAAVADKLLDVLGRPYAVSGFAVTVEPVAQSPSGTSG